MLMRVHLRYAVCKMGLIQMGKVLMISTFGDFFWSFERGNISLLNELGCKVILVANFDDKKYNHKIKEIQSLGVEITNVPFERSPFKIATIKNYFYLKKIIENEKPILVDCHLAVVGVLSRIACLRKKTIRIIYSPHGFFFYKGCSIFNKIVYKTMESLLARKTDALITINSEDYNNARKMKIRGNAYYVPGVGVDVDAIQKKENGNPYLRELIGATDDELILISVGELSKNKNHIVVIEAIKAIHEKGIKNIHYVICGRDDTERKIIEERVNEYGLQKKFHFLGYRTDVVELNKQASCFILPSYKEGLSVSIIEAMACGLPVIASRIRGNVDLIDEGLGGYLFDPNDSAELVEAIQNVMLNDRINTMGSYNMSKCKKYSLESVHSSMKMIYGEVLDGNKEK